MPLNGIEERRMFGFLKRQDAVTAPLPEVKASAAGGVIAWGGAGRVAWTPRDTVSLTKAGFIGNPVGFRAVKLIAEAAAALPLILQDSQRRYDTHPVLDLIARPNGSQGRAELFEALFGQILLTGNGYLEAVAAEGDDLPYEMHVLRSDRMSLVPGADGWPVAYEYNVNGRKHRFNVGEGASPVCHIKSFHPQDDHYGFSRCRRRPAPSMSTTRPRAGPRRCSTMPRARLAPSSIAGRMVNPRSARISMTGW
jgi:phage portal protein BeeE